MTTCRSGYLSRFARWFPRHPSRGACARPRNHGVRAAGGEGLADFGQSLLALEGGSTAKEGDWSAAGLGGEKHFFGGGEAGAEFWGSQRILRKSSMHGPGVIQ